MSLVCRARINVGDWVQVLNLRSTKIFKLAQGQTKGQGEGRERGFSRQYGSCGGSSDHLGAGVNNQNRGLWACGQSHP